MTEQKKKPGRPSGSANKTTKSTTSKSTGSRSQKSTKSREDLEKLVAKKRLRDEIWSIVLIALGLFLVVSVQTQAAGQFGHAIQLLLKGCFGFMAYILPYYLIVYGILLFTKHMTHIGARSITCLVLIFLMLTILNSGLFISDLGTEKFTPKFFQDVFESGTELKSGGAFGMFIGLLLVKAVGKMGLYILSVVTIVICGLMVTNTPISQFFDGWKEKRLAALAKREEEDAAVSIIENEKPDSPSQNMRGDIKKAPSFSFFGGGASGHGRTAAGTSSRELSAGISPGQRKILDYMKDENLFDTSLTSEGNGLGLEDAAAAVPGMGLWSVGESESADPSAAADVQTAKKPDVESLLAALPEAEPYSESEPLIHIPEKLQQDEPGDTVDFCWDIPSDSVETADTSILPKAAGFDPEYKSTDEMTAEGAESSGGSSLAPAPETARPSREKRGDEKPERTGNESVPELKIVSGGKALKPYKMPPIDLLNRVAADKNIGEQAALQAKAMKLEETLHNFGVNAKVVQVTKGPAVTRYEIQPNTGVKVSSIVRLSDDIALNLEARSIRMEAPIPGKAAVGIEVENDRVNMVSIREIVDSTEFKAAKSRISFAVGKDIAGNAIVADLKGMPHLLIAGSTGSGKSVCINSLIISILYKSKPDEVKFVLIDPKVVELSNYNGIPHLLIPVVTDPSKAAAALNWAVAEMTDRYKKFAEEGVRDLAGFNEAVKAKGEGDRFMPQVVIIIDELADLMMAAPSQVEESICRLAQMARAAGMHLIVATQRPSVDIITGVIKANIPSRIAFAVSSQFDSRTILDMAGAEKLVGKGDMLFNPLGMGKPLRVQGCFISDSEVHKVIEYLKNNGPETEYASDVIHSIDRVQSDTSSVDNDGDELLADAIETVVRAEQASVSMLQRRFRIGYNRAARLVDMMESRGIIGPADGSRPRKVLMSLEELEAMNAGPDGNSDTGNE